MYVEKKGFNGWLEFDGCYSVDVLYGDGKVNRVVNETCYRERVRAFCPPPLSGQGVKCSELSRIFYN